MSLANALAAKLVLAVTATAVLGVGTATVVQRQEATPGRHPRAQAGAQAVLPSDPSGAGGAGGEVVIDPGTGALRILAGPEEARVGVGAGARTTGGPGPGRQGPAGAQAPSYTAGGSASAVSPGAGSGTVTVPGTGAGVTVGTTPGGSGGTGGTGGSNTGGSPPPPGSGGGGTPPPQGGGWSVTAPPAPEAPAVTRPTVPSGASAHSEGSFTLTVPGTGQVSKKLCLSGTVANRCQTMTVPAVRPVELTVTYSGNAGVEAPKFTTSPCRGGASVGVSGLAPGATLNVVVEGSRVSAKVPERGAQQAASLCDA